MKNLFKAFAVAVLILFAQEGFSQGPPSSPTGDCGEGNPCGAIPIDGGLSWLLAAGGIYGVSKLRKNFKK